MTTTTMKSIYWLELSFTKCTNDKAILLPDVWVHLACWFELGKSYIEMFAIVTRLLVTFFLGPWEGVKGKVWTCHANGIRNWLHEGWEALRQTCPSSLFIISHSFLHITPFLHLLEGGIRNKLHRWPGEPISRVMRSRHFSLHRSASGLKAPCESLLSLYIFPHVCFGQ